jgi:hypothetical protein
MKIEFFSARKLRFRRCGDAHYDDLLLREHVRARRATRAAVGYIALCSLVVAATCTYLAIRVEQVDRDNARLRDACGVSP